MLFRAVLIGGSVVVYILLFLLTYRQTGGATVAFALAPVAVSGWLLGRWGGLLAGVFVVPVNMLLLYVAGSPGWADLGERWPGIIIEIALGVGVGWVSELVNKVKSYADALAQERAALSEHIAERRRLEDALRASEQRLRTIIDIEPACVKIMTDEGVILEMNRAGLAILQADRPDSVIGHSIFEFVTPEHHKAIENINTRIIRGEPASLEFELMDLKGVRRWMETHGVPLMDEATDTRRQLAIARDITDRKQAERALRESEERYRSLFNDIPVGVYRTTPEGQILSVNPTLVQMLRFPDRETLMAANVINLYVQPEDRRQWQATLRRDGVVRQNEFQARRYDESIIWVRNSARAVNDEAGNILYYDGVLEDITERKRLEDQLRQAQKMEAIGQLAGGVAHDFNNVLTVINGYYHLIMTNLGPGNPLQSDLKEIKTAADQATTLVRQLLAFSRRDRSQPRLLDLNQVITDIEKMLRRLTGEHIPLTLKLNPGLDRVKADPGQLEQVLMNLVVNARDAMPEGGKLTIETANVELDEAYARTHTDARPGRYVMLVVEDTGFGMDAETLTRIFEPFFTTKESGKGTGLGLSTVYGIVKQSHGHIEVQSVVGQGSMFRIYLPRLAALADMEQPSSVDTPLSSGYETILVVEDEESVRMMTRAVLERQGYTVLEAANGAEALDYASRHPGMIHLVIADLIMPEMNGDVLVERLKGLYNKLKIIYITGYADDILKQTIDLKTPALLLRKPFTAATLTETVRQTLDAAAASM